MAVRILDVDVDRAPRTEIIRSARGVGCELLAISNATAICVDDLLL